MNVNEEKYLFSPPSNMEFLEMKEARLTSVMLWVQVQFAPSFYPPSITPFFKFDLQKKAVKLQIAWSQVEPRHLNANQKEAGNSNYVCVCVCVCVYVCGVQTGCTDPQQRGREEFFEVVLPPSSPHFTLNNTQESSCATVWEGERERKRQRETERKRQRERERQRERASEREREKEHQTFCNNWP